MGANHAASEESTHVDDVEKSRDAGARAGAAGPPRRHARPC